MPVNADLSDLEEKIRWCRANDAKCKEIGQNAIKFYEKYVGKQALLDYVEMVCKSVAARYMPPPDWWTPAPKEESPPKLRRPDVPCYEDKQSGQSRLCIRCQEDEELEAQHEAEDTAKAAAQKSDKKSTRAKLRERMKKRIKQS